MFLSSNPDLYLALGIKEKSRTKRGGHRNIAYWFKDIQSTIDKDCSENAQLRLICEYEYIYQIIVFNDVDTNEEEMARFLADVSVKDKLQNQKHLVYRDHTSDEYNRAYWEMYDAELRDAREFVARMYSDNLDRRYQRYVNGLLQIADVCDTLSMLEKQLDAFEKQQGLNSTAVELHYEIEDIPESVFYNLYDVSVLDGLFKENWEKNDFILKCKNLWKKCRQQPLSLPLFPALLTILMFDGNTYKTISPYLKSKKHYISFANMKNLGRLFDAVCEQLRLGYKDYNRWIIPIFDWKGIEERFYDHLYLNVEDQECAHFYLERLRYKNGLSKSEERELAKLPYGNKLRSLARICNLNSYMMIRLQSNMGYPDLTDQSVILPNKTKSAYEMLRQGELLPPQGPPEKFNSYFREGYNEWHGELFSYIALGLV